MAPLPARRQLREAGEESARATGGRPALETLLGWPWTASSSGWTRTGCHNDAWVTRCRLLADF